MQGFCDPFNRAPYHVEDTAIRDWYQKLAQIRRAHPALQTGAAAMLAPALDVIGVLRTTADGADVFSDGQKRETILVLVNRTEKQVECTADLFASDIGLDTSSRNALLRAGYQRAVSLTDETSFSFEDGLLSLKLAPCSVQILKLEA